jgi:uncharacterized protein (DUF1330 family)
MAASLEDNFVRLVRMLQEYHFERPDPELPTILVEFDSYDIALAAHKSEAYQKALQALGSGAERDYHIVEGA